MFTPMSITSFNQGRDLAHWHVRRLYAEPVHPNLDRRESHAGLPHQVVAEAAASPARGRRSAVLIAYWRAAFRVFAPHRRREQEISAT